MIGLAIALAIMLILSTVATQAWVDVIRRDNEAEMIFRAEEIVRALARYQMDRATLPTELEQLLEPGNRGQYFIRKLYEDPLVPDGKWGLIYSAPGGGIYDPNASALPGMGPDEVGLGSLDRMTTTPLGTSGNTGTLSGQQGVAGLPIAGVKSLCKEKPFRHYRDFTEYSTMLFTVYDLVPGAPGNPGQPGQPGAGQRGVGSGGRRQPGGLRQPGTRGVGPGGGTRRNR